MDQRKPRRGRPGEPRPGIFDNRTRLVALAMVAFALVLLVWSLRGSSPPPAPVAAAPDDSSGQAGGGGHDPFTALGMAPSSGAPTGTASAGPQDPPPVIDEIVLEKKE